MTQLLWHGCHRRRVAVVVVVVVVVFLFFVFLVRDDNVTRTTVPNWRFGAFQVSKC